MESYVAAICKSSNFNEGAGRAAWPRGSALGSYDVLFDHMGPQLSRIGPLQGNGRVCQWSGVTTVGCDNGRV